MEVSSRASNPFSGRGGTVTKLSLTTGPIAGISFPPLGETEGEGMRRLLFVVAAILVACAGCSSLFSHSWEEYVDSWDSYNTSYSSSGRAIHSPAEENYPGDTAPKKK